MGSAKCQHQERQLSYLPYKNYWEFCGWRLLWFIPVRYLLFINRSLLLFHIVHTHPKMLWLLSTRIWIPGYSIPNCIPEKHNHIYFSYTPVFLILRHTRKDAKQKWDSFPGWRRLSSLSKQLGDRNQPLRVIWQAQDPAMRYW